MIDGTDIAEALNHVVVELNKLGLHVFDELNHHPVWVDNGQGEFVDNRDRIIYAIKHFKPVEGLSPQQTLACVGAVGGNDKTAELIVSTNQAKDSFAHVVHRYMAEHEIKDTAAIRHILAYNGFPGIKLKQVYRHLHWIGFHPRRISFSQVKHNSRRIITKAQAEQRLFKAGKGLHIDVQLAKLSLLDHNATLVIHRDVPDCWIANIATFKNEKGVCTTSHVYSSIPLFYRHDQSQFLPDVVFAQKYTRLKSGSRANRLIEEQVFLPSISAYRYK